MHMSLTKGALLVNAVACLALAAVLADTRRELEAVRAEHPPTAGPHRALDGEEEPGGDALMRATVENLVKAQREGAAATARLRTNVAALAGNLSSFDARVEELRRDADLSARRRAQGAEPEPEPEPDLGGENVKIVKRSVVYCGGPGGTTNVGTFDYSQCADRAFASCHADACAGHTGHRRAQAIGTCGDVPGRAAQITAACCDEPTEDCSGGYPHTCNAECAAIFLPFWTDCRSSLGKNSAQFEPAVALCEAASPATAAPSLAEQLNVQCADGTAAADCVPECSETYHGYLLLLNIEGEDSKLSCELHHGFCARY
eukprot:COSAG06_NODE_7121_length_2623_cov_18.988906_1_plen_316_part_00